MTPSEVRGLFQVHLMQRKHAEANLDKLAWLSGSYMVTSFHAPKRYPHKPRNAEKIMGPSPAKEMTDDQLKNAMMAFAKRWNDGRKP